MGAGRQAGRFAITKLSIIMIGIVIMQRAVLRLASERLKSANDQRATYLGTACDATHRPYVSNGWY